MSILRTSTLISNLIKVKNRVFRNHNLTLLLPSYYVPKKFYASEKTKTTSKETAVKTGITNLVDTTLSQTKIPELGVENIAKTDKEESWKKMKFSLVFIIGSCLAITAFIVKEFGKPKIGLNGYEIYDEYSDRSTWLQYMLRSLHELDNYQRLIKQPSREKLLPDTLKPPYHQPKQTLILELIDVLVHPDWTYHTGWRFKKRPGLDQFLEVVSSFYEIVIYTAEQGMTVFPIIEALDPRNLISYKLVRDATHFVDGHHVKNLDHLNRDLENVIVVDWNSESVKFHQQNLFRIPRWDGNDEDTALIDLTEFLMTVAQSDVQDVRDVLNYYKEFENGLLAFREKQKKLLEQVEDERRSKTKSVLPSTHWSSRITHEPV